MRLCESILMAIIVMLGTYVVYTDFKRGTVQNKALVYASFAGVIINAVYLGHFCSDFFVLYLANLLMISVMSIALYAFHFWAAGDSKLLICVTLLFPARLYDKDVFSFAPGMNVIIYIFLISYVYIIIDSLICCVKKERFYTQGRFKVSSIKYFLVNYFVCFLYVRGCGSVLRFLLGDIYYQNQLIFSFINIFLAIIVHGKNIFRKWYFIVSILIINILFISYDSIHTFDISYVYGYLVLLIALILRYLLNGFNYQEIPTTEVKEGMILSIATVMLFYPSKVVGLPNNSFEDMRSRLNGQEVDAIMRWKDSRYGRETITIVRKIPFAVFIILGEVVYFFVRIWK